MRTALFVSALTLAVPLGFINISDHQARFIGFFLLIFFAMDMFELMKK